jgi:hypothetical protein
MCVLKSTFAFKIGIALCALFMVVVPATTADATGGRPEDPSHALRAVEEAAAELVAKEDGPPGVIVHAHMRLASVAKAFSGATALALVARGCSASRTRWGSCGPTCRTSGRTLRCVSC